jgi:hypothetical protein
MIRLASVIGTYENDLLTQYHHKLSFVHLRALSAMKKCRTQMSLKMQVQCQDCDHQILIPHSCGHRHCPHCQHHESQQWLDNQIRKQLPAPYFMVTFTLPAEFRPLVWAHQTIIYELLMRCAWETVRTFSQNDQKLQGIPGATAVLHTNTRRQDYHPHVHLVMPAVAIDRKQKRFRIKRSPGTKRAKQHEKTKGGYLFNEDALAIVFRAKILAGIEAAGLKLPCRYPKEWVVHSKSVGTGEKALIYLGCYLYRGVIREKDILSYGNGQVCFRYRNADTGKLERRTVSGAEFLWLIIQHVLPKGFRRARNFGFLHPNSKRMIHLLHLLLKFAPNLSLVKIKERPPILCPCCGGVMKIVQTRLCPSGSEQIPIPFAVQGVH